MSEPAPSAWLPWLLFRLTLAVAGALVAAVLLAPLLDAGTTPTDGWSRLLALFARDATLRRTALASAVGLAVTACVFFQGSEVSGRAPKTPRPPSNVGA